MAENQQSHSPSRRALLVRSMKAKANRDRSFTEKLADFMTATFGSITFLIINVIWFFVWIAINVGFILGIEPFDPFPFGLLTMIVSLQAIFLAIFVLISQNREAKINDLREEVDLQMDVMTEKELTKVLELVVKLLEKNKIDISGDTELKEMLEKTNIEKLEKSIERQMD